MWDLENTVIGSTVFGHMSVWEKAADCVCKRARAREHISKFAHLLHRSRGISEQLHQRACNSCAPKAVSKSCHDSLRAI